MRVLKSSLREFVLSADMNLKHTLKHLPHKKEPRPYRVRLCVAHDVGYRNRAFTFLLRQVGVP